MSQFSKEIKNIRAKTVMSQQELADALGVSVSSLSRWESGKSKPTYRTLKKIDKFCREREIKFDVYSILGEAFGE